jgi:DNA-binding NtrC family response regulator
MSYALPIPTPVNPGPDPDVVIANAEMRAAYALVRRVARTDVPVLLLGETGVGKEVLARELHSAGPRGNGPLVVLNCGAVPAGLLESTLFGHERGAFTDARCTQRGMFETASGGTLFLDEIGELPLAAQVALLRVLETKRLTRIGGATEIPVDARVVAATNRDLTEAVANGTFRLDLLHRINALTIRVPPLRERADEIDALIDALLPEAARQCGNAVAWVSDAARACLRAYRWPGNVRQLRNTLQRAALECDGDTIEVEHLPDEIRGANGHSLVVPAAPRQAAPASSSAPAEPTAEAAPVIAAGGDGARIGLKQQMMDYERRVILDALRRTNGNRRRAAALLRTPLRTLARKIRVHGIRTRAELEADDGF